VAVSGIQTAICSLRSIPSPCGILVSALIMTRGLGAHSWDSRWLHAVMQLLYREGWSWAELGGFAYELLQSPPPAAGDAGEAASLEAEQQQQQQQQQRSEDEGGDSEESEESDRDEYI
jgi:hypothetical protein